MKYIITLFLLIIGIAFILGFKMYWSIDEALVYYDQPHFEKPSSDKVKNDLGLLFVKEKEKKSKLALRDNSHRLLAQDSRGLIYEDEDPNKNKHLITHQEHLESIKNFSVHSLNCNDYDECVLELRHYFFSLNQQFVSNTGKVIRQEDISHSEVVIEIYNQKLKDLQEIYPE